MFLKIIKATCLSNFMAPPHLVLNNKHKKMLNILTITHSLASSPSIVLFSLLMSYHKSFPICNVTSPESYPKVDFSYWECIQL